MNKTLSLIEEENEDEFFTNNDDERHSNATGSAFNKFGETIRQLPLSSAELEEINKINRDSSESESAQQVYQRKSTSEDINLLPVIPEILRDIESMEKEFTKFLELIYN